MKKLWLKLSDVLFFQEGPGVRKNQYTTHGVKLLNVANLVDGNIDLSTSSRYISKEEAFGKYKHFLCDVGDFIVASSGIKVEYLDRKMGFVDETMLPLCMNTSTIRFKVLDESQLNIRYFMYYVKSKHFKQQVEFYITGSAQLNYGPSHLRKMFVPIIDISEQLNIIEKLDKLQSIMDKYREKLRKYDELIKARFVEMFGDVKNEEKYKGIALKNICKTMSGGTPSTKNPEYYSGQIPWITTISLGENYIDGNNAKGYITQQAIDNSATKLVPKDSILFGTRVGVGKSSINEVEMCTNQDIVAIINVDKSKYNNLFIKNVLDAYQPYYDSLKKGATILGITSDDLKNTLIPIVPLNLQNQFADFVKQIDKSKFVELKQYKNRVEKINSPKY